MRHFFSSMFMCARGSAVRGSRANRLIAPAALTALLLASAAGAVDVPLDGVGGTPDPGSSSAGSNLPDGHHSNSPGATTATIRGRVFYNDRRQHGLFGERRDKSGAVGKRCNPDGKRDDGSACSVNWLGGRYMVVDVIERDEGFAFTDVNCKKEDVIASATVGRDGAFAVTIPVSDACRHDDLAEMAIQLRVRLRFCNADYCFSVNDKKNRPYTVSSANASATNPLIVRAGDDVTVADMHFSTAADAATPNNDSIAANYYASVVDAIIWLHKDNPIPFYKEEYGELQFIFPSNKSKTATTRSADEVVISNFASQPKGGAFAWIGGETPAHEIGHVLMLRAWDGDYGFNGVGNSANNKDRVDSQQIGFKEAWAAFVARAVFEPTYSCAKAKFDDNSGTAPKSTLGDGTWWRLNMVKALCDWYDRRDDDDRSIAGGGDYFAAEDIYSMWYNLRRMYVDRDAYGGKYRNPGLWFCDYVKYYLDVRKSAAAVGRSSHDGYVEKIRDLLYNNNIGCYLPAPS